MVPLVALLPWIGGIGLAGMGNSGAARAQAPAAHAARDELLALVPKEYGLCVVVMDLRGQAAKLQSAAWIGRFKASPLGAVLLAAPEWKNLAGFEAQLKKHLDLDWAALRDDILGDAVVFAFQLDPGGQADKEQGVLLLKAPKPALLKQTMERLDRLQMQSGEIKTLEPRQHKGKSYVVRGGSPKGTQYYLVDDAFFAFASSEDVIRATIDARAGGQAPSPRLAQQFERAGADKALVSMWINPRVFDADVQAKAKFAAGPERVVLQSFLAHWQALDAAIVSMSVGADVELKLSLQARVQEMPESAKGLYDAPSQASDLWTRFPEDAVVTVAGRTDFAHVAAVLTELAPPEARQSVTVALKPLADLAGLDLMKKIAPNLGPDWGFAIMAADDPRQTPRLLATLAVRPGSKEAPVDQAIFQGLNLMAGLAILDHNSKSPNPIRLHGLRQDGAELRYLSGDKVFPAGVQPTFGLKDGYFLLATAPDAVVRFKTGAAPPPAAGEAPLLRLSTVALAKLLRAQRATVVDHIAARNQITPTQASQALDLSLGALDLLERVELTQKSGGGQAAWTLRLRMAK